MLIAFLLVVVGFGSLYYITLRDSKARLLDELNNISNNLNENEKILDFFVQPTGMAVDENDGLLYVADTINNRILVFELGEDGLPIDNHSDYVIGQKSFTGTSGDIGSKKTNYPYNLLLDEESNYLYVTDFHNNRVLVFNTTNLHNGLEASFVLGQLDFLSRFPTSGVDGLNNPFDLSFDINRNYLFVADNGNNRVLVYNTMNLKNGLEASFVLGQDNFLETVTGTTKYNFSDPSALSFDEKNNYLYVGDFDNNRVLIYDTTNLQNGLEASFVLGQDDFTGSYPGLSRDTFNKPYDLDIFSDNLFLVDKNNNRVLVFNTINLENGLEASFVLGQGAFIDSFSGSSISRFDGPFALEIDKKNQRLLVSDVGNNRILFFNIDKVESGQKSVYSLEFNK